MRATEAGFIVLLAGAALAPALLPAGSGDAATAAAAREVPWPSDFEGHPLTALPLSPVEQRFAAQFPGQIARFSDGERNIILRVVQQPTRLLHPAADCFRGLGYRVDAPSVVADAAAVKWSCFIARTDGHALRVCERIHDAEGNAWTDVSSWYWAALIGRTHAPWSAVTVAMPQ